MVNGLNNCGKAKMLLFTSIITHNLGIASLSRIERKTKQKLFKKADTFSSEGLKFTINFQYAITVSIQKCVFMSVTAPNRSHCPSICIRCNSKVYQNLFRQWIEHCFAIHPYLSQSPALRLNGGCMFCLLWSSIGLKALSGYPISCLSRAPSMAPDDRPQCIPFHTRRGGTFVCV